MLSPTQPFSPFFFKKPTFEIGDRVITPTSDKIGRIGGTITEKKGDVYHVEVDRGSRRTGLFKGHELKKEQ